MDVCSGPHTNVLKQVFRRMHIVEQVDPGFLRTLVVASKFDNR